MGKCLHKYFFSLIFMMSAALSYSQETDSLRHYSLEETILVSEKGRRPVSGLMTGNLTLDLGDLDWLPQILGTPDILKTLQLMPGVTASGEMDSGVYVRGADPGQVSVLFDGARIWFPSHLLSFYSVFNSDHLSAATVLKSGISPSYGGGVSGVIDVSSPEELPGKAGGKVNMGLISSQATCFSPLGRKSSIRLSGRGTYVNWLLKNLTFAQDQAQPLYGFHDGNMTFVCKPDGNNLIKLNAYYSKDDLTVEMGGYSLDGRLDWTNAAASLVWDSGFGNDVKMKNTVSLSVYDNFVEMHREQINVSLPSGIMDLSYKGNVSVPIGRSSILVGADYVFHRTKVQTPLVSGLYDSGREPLMETDLTHEYGMFAEYSKWFDVPFRFSAGLRYSGAVTDGAFYHGLEPRLSLSYDFSENMRLRASVMRQMQYVNTVSVSGMGLPTDFLVPAGPSIRPQAATTASVGFSHSFSGNIYEYSIEPYWSEMDNLLEFDGEMFDLFMGDYSTKDHILSGRGRNFGIEFMFKKNSGKVNGWVSYTLSRALRSFPGIMDGKTFRSKHDRLHNLSCVANYCPSERWTFSAVFIYGSGTPYTAPSGLYLIGENLIQEYGSHNGARMPDYNRMDISATYDFPERGRLTHSLNLSFYNVYAYKNPLFRDIRPEYDEENPTNLKLHLVGVCLFTFLPSLSYTLTF